MDEYLAEEDSQVISVQTLTEPEITFVFAMLGKWERKSRYMLDFNTPMLCNKVFYRARGEVKQLGAWIRKNDSIPCAPTEIEVAKTALRKYITENRLYSHYAAAHQLLAQVAVQYVPDTLEATSWLAYTRTLKIPKFNACRGRYTPLLAHDAGMLTSRSMSEFAYFGAELSISKVAMVMMAEGYQTGVAVRASRCRNEIDSKDISLTEGVLRTPQAHWVALVSEGIRTPVPTIQMTDCYAIILDLPLDRQYGTAFVKVDKASEPGYLIEKCGDDNIIRTTYMLVPGVQIMSAPTEPFPEESPYSLSVSLSVPDSRRDRYGAEMTMMEAWKYAWIMRICGYDVDIESPRDFCIQQRFFASNETRWTHCLQKLAHNRRNNLYVSDVKSRNDPHRLLVPRIHEEGIRHTLNMQLDYVSRGVSQSDQVGHHPVSSSHGFYTTGDFDVQRVVVHKAYESLKAFVVRDNQGFRFVESVEAALMPQSTVDTAAAIVEPISVIGTNNGEQ